MAAWTVVLSFFAASLVTINANDHQHFGIGFAGSRGKRSFDDEPNKNDGLLYAEDSPISNLIANYSSSFSSDPDYLRNLPELSLFKRAPSGFLGMRGKKDFEYSDFVRRQQMEDGLTPEMKWKKLLLAGPNGMNIPIRFMNGQFPKRAPSGFLGMRGKKLWMEAAENNKRGPQGFLGMRGKKDILDLMYGNSNNNWNNNNPQLYNSLQNEQKLLNDISRIYELDSEDPVKRAPSAGFFGMRGKKLYEDTLYDDMDSFDKRAPSGFLGMRGKKALDYSFDSVEEDKRAPMGFLGMRGKKDVSAQLEKQKRSSLAQYFGIRGKKQPLNSGFFGMRGKKQPMEFRGKFVGVRGKKGSSSSLQQLEEQLGNIENNEQKESQSNAAEEHRKVKRAASSALDGMRGIKFLEQSSSTQN